MVEGKRGWRDLVESADLKHGRVILIFEGPVPRNALPLLWQSMKGLYRSGAGFRQDEVASSIGKKSVG
jgi:hypothetical protein